MRDSSATLPSSAELRPSMTVAAFWITALPSVMRWMADSMSENVPARNCVPSPTVRAALVLVAPCSIRARALVLSADRVLEISAVERLVWVARFFTSLATTAKPLPASPARAASMVALSASRLVWREMASIEPITVSTFSSAADSSASRPWLCVTLTTMVSICWITLSSRDEDCRMFSAARSASAHGAGGAADDTGIVLAERLRLGEDVLQHLLLALGARGDLADIAAGVGHLVAEAGGIPGEALDEAVLVVRSRIGKALCCGGHVLSLCQLGRPSIHKTAGLRKPKQGRADRPQSARSPASLPRRWLFGPALKFSSGSAHGARFPAPARKAQPKR